MLLQDMPNSLRMCQFPCISGHSLVTNMISSENDNIPSSVNYDSQSDFNISFAHCKGKVCRM